MLEAKKEKLYLSSGSTSAFLDRKPPHATVRTTKSELLTPAIKCPWCIKYRNTLRTMFHRWRKQQSVGNKIDARSHKNNRWLTSPEKASQLRERVKSAEAAVKKKIEASTKRLGVEVDDSLHSGLEGNKISERERE